MSRERAGQLVDAGVWLKLSGDLEGARKLFARALVLDPDNAKARQLLGEVSAEDSAPPLPPAPALDDDWGGLTGVEEAPPLPAAAVLPPPRVTPPQYSGSVAAVVGTVELRGDGEVEPPPQPTPPQFSRTHLAPAGPSVAPPPQAQTITLGDEEPLTFDTPLPSTPALFTSAGRPAATSAWDAPPAPVASAPGLPSPASPKFDFSARADLFVQTPPPAPQPAESAWAWNAAAAPAQVEAALEPVPAPRPSPHLSPVAQSAWDQRSNPGIKLEAVVGRDRALDLISSDSRIVRSPESRKAEAAALLRKAKDLLGLDDHTGAMEVINQAQALAPDDPDVMNMRERSEKTLLTMFESKLGALEKVPRVLLKDDEIIWLNLDHRAGFVLAQIDGTVSFDDLFSVSGMSRLDTARILAQLVEEGVISRG